MSFKKVAVLLILFCRCSFAFAQSETDVIIEQIVESVTDDLGEDYDYSELVDKLTYYHKNPININKTSGEELHELIFLTPLQVNALLKHRDQNGAFIDLLELQSIEGLDIETVRMLLPFIRLDQVNSLAGISANEIFKKGHNDLMLRYGQILQKQIGFLITDTAKSHYFGTPQRLFLRYRYTYGQHVFASLNMEKDAGESFFSGAQSKGFDFYSGNIFFKNAGKFRKIVIGDYALQFGQGLTMWAGLGFGKGAAIATVTKPDIGLRPYSSANEALFFRGVAATIDLNRISFTPFISYRNLDAGFSPGITATDAEVSSLSQTGFHRTATEINNRNTLRQLIYGMNVQYTSRNFNAGIIGYQTSFDHVFEPGQSEYNKFEFSGRSLLNTGIYYNRTWRNMYFFGEAAHSINGGFSYLNGILTSLSPQVSLVMLHRNYQKNYQSFYSMPIAEGSNGANEKGFYSGLTLVPAARFELAMYADFFSFPWLKYRVDAPSNGFEVYSQLSYTIKNKLKATLRYKREEKEQNGEANTTVQIPETVQKQGYRAELSYKISKNVELRNRAEISQYRKGDATPEFGYLVFQDVIFNPLQSALSGNIRFAIFDTPGYDSRIYAYENDVLYGYSIPALQNSGLRLYANARYTMARGIDLWVKYGVTKFTDLDEVGSGLDLIAGNTRSEIKVQLRFQF